jgi:hypothetical protein
VYNFTSGVLAGVPVPVDVAIIGYDIGCDKECAVIVGVGVTLTVVACSKVKTSILVVTRFGGGHRVSSVGGHFLFHDSPSVILIGRDLAAFQEIPERVSSIDTGIGCVGFVIVIVSDPMRGVRIEEVKVSMIAFTSLRAEAIIAIVGFAFDSKALGFSSVVHSRLVSFSLCSFTIFYLKE